MRVSICHLAASTCDKNFSFSNCPYDARLTPGLMIRLQDDPNAQREPGWADFDLAQMFPTTPVDGELRVALSLAMGEKSPIRYPTAPIRRGAEGPTVRAAAPKLRGARWEAIWASHQECELPGSHELVAGRAIGRSSK